MQLIYDKPASRGVENALKRARRLCQLRWTPIRPLPSALKGVAGTDQEYFYGYFRPWMPQRGIPYSSCRTVEKYVGWNISAETFCTALQNPHSVVYTRQLKESAGNKANSYYGSVCSMFVSYALELPYRIVCKDWLALDSIHPVDSEQLENLRLGDILLDPKRHVALITGIARDEAGTVQRIEVSECTLPLTICTAFTPVEFCNYWLKNNYTVHRYDGIDNVTYTSLPELFTASDIISLHCPLTEDTYHIIDECSLAKCKKEVVILNTSRGALVDAEALLAAIKSRKVGAACLDVYEEEADFFFEDFSGHIIEDDILARLISMPNVIVSSHQAFLTEEALSNIAETTVNNILEIFDRGTCENELRYKQ
jgi:hypothetical protein